MMGAFVTKIMDSTINGECYAAILNEIVVPTLTSIRYVHHFYQQDGAPAHFSRNVREILNNLLPYRWIGRHGPIAWPPRSPDLSLNDFWFLGWLREQVYKELRQTTLYKLSNRIEDSFNNIDFDMIKRSFTSFIKRCEMCVINNGGHFEQFC